MNSTHQFKRLSFGGSGAADDIFNIFGLEKGKLDRYNEANRLLSVAADISNIYIWVVFAFGVPGNILATITILTMQAIVPTTFFVSVIAILDATSLVGKLTAHQLVRNGIYIGTVGCKFQFLIICAGTLANWVLMLICAERFFTVCYPEKKKRIFTNRNCYFAVTILSVIFVIFFASVSGAMRGVDFSGLRCGTYNQYLWFWMNVWFWINSALYLFIPCLCVFPMIVLIVRKLHLKNRKGIKHLDKENENETTVIEQPCRTDDELENNEGGFTLMVIVAALLFLVLSLPACIYFLSYRRRDDALIEAQWVLFEQIQYVFVDSRHAINCSLYFLSSARFRKQMIRLLLCKTCTETRSSRDQEVQISSSV